MGAPRKYPEELRERAVRLAVEARRDPITRAGALRRIGEQLGINPLRRCGIGCSRPRSMPATGRVSPLTTLSGLRSWSVRSASCGGRIRF